MDTTDNVNLTSPADIIIRLSKLRAINHNTIQAMLQQTAFLGPNKSNLSSLSCNNNSLWSSHSMPNNPHYQLSMSRYKLSPWPTLCLLCDHPNLQTQCNVMCWHMVDQTTCRDMVITVVRNLYGVTMAVPAESHSYINYGGTSSDNT